MCRINVTQETYENNFWFYFQFVYESYVAYMGMKAWIIVDDAHDIYARMNFHNNIQK